MYLRPAIRCLTGSSNLLRMGNLQNNISLTPASSGQILNLVRLASTEHNTPSKESEQIYYGTLSPKIRAVKVFSLTTSVVGLAVQPMLIEQGTKMGGVPMVVFLCGFAGLFTFVTPALLHFITKKYVTQISYNAEKDEYLANTISFFLFNKKVSKIKTEILCLKCLINCYVYFSTHLRHPTFMFRM